MKIAKNKLAKIIVQELGGCFIPSLCLEPPIKPLDKDGDHYVETYRSINRIRREERKWLMERVEKVLKRLNEV
jgi:hypothetical protein